jgi:tetratricopeptide (TPR) repeat protein
MWSAAWALLEGRSRQALTYTDKALALGQQARDPEASSIYWTQQLDLLLEWGADGEMDGLVDVWRDIAHGHDQDPTWRASLALLLARTGRREQAADELDHLLSDNGADFPLDRNWVATVAAISEVAADLEDRRCAALASLLSPYARRLIVVGPGVVCRGSVARVLGLLSAATGNWTAAERQFQAALSAHDRVNARPLVARTRFDFGRALARKRGGPLHAGRVRTTLDQAIEEAEHLGLARLASQARAERAKLN